MNSKDVSELHDEHDGGEI